MAGIRKQLAVIGLAALGLLLSAGPASATTIFTHTFIESFDAAGSQSSTGSTGPFSAVDHLAIDQSNGAVYVLDTNYGVLSRFDCRRQPVPVQRPRPGRQLDPCRKPLRDGGRRRRQLGDGHARDRSTPSAKASRPTPSLPTEPSSAATSPFSPPNGGTCAGAVGPQGDFWWGSYGGGVYGYNSAGFPLPGDNNLAPGSYVCPIAINSADPPSPTSGYFYVANYGGGGTQVFDSNRNSQVPVRHRQRLGHGRRPRHRQHLRQQLRPRDRVGAQHDRNARPPGQQLRRPRSRTRLPRHEWLRSRNRHQPHHPPRLRRRLQQGRSSSGPAKR